MLTAKILKTWELSHLDTFLEDQKKDKELILNLKLSLTIIQIDGF